MYINLVLALCVWKAPVSPLKSTHAQHFCDLIDASVIFPHQAIQ